MPLFPGYLLRKTLPYLRVAREIVEKILQIAPAGPEVLELRFLRIFQYLFAFSFLFPVFCFVQSEAQNVSLNEGWTSIRTPVEIDWSDCGISADSTFYPLRSAIDAGLIGAKALSINERGGFSSVGLPGADASDSTILKPGITYWVKASRPGLELVMIKPAVSADAGRELPPARPVVSCTPESASPSVLQASWTAAEGGGEAAEYKYAAGTCDGCSNIVPWTSTGLRTSFERGGLALELGSQYFISVKGANEAGAAGEKGSCSTTIVEHISPHLRSQIDDNGIIDEIVVPPSPLPPPGAIRPAAGLEASLFQVPEAHAAATGVNILSDVPASDWAYGCSATSAAMMMGYYDRTSYPDMYTGTVDGGVFPLTNATWGYGENPLSASHLGYDGRVARGGVDDFWIGYGNSDPDPYITNGWTMHTFGDAVGDYMGTNQSAVGNSDGSTTFWSYNDGRRLYNYTGCEPSSRDGIHGLRDFVEARGYSVVANYNQYIFGYNGNTQGFSFSDLQTEIDAGRPVLIQVEGHTMLGYGYDTSSNTIYIHDTWDHLQHTMTWGGSYSGMIHYGVAVIQLSGGEPTRTPTPIPAATQTAEPTVTPIPTLTETPAPTNVPYQTPTPVTEATNTPGSENPDTVAPSIRALSSSVKANRTGTLKYVLNDSSNRSSEAVKILRGARTVKTIRTGMSRIPADHIRRLSLRASLSRRLYIFCVKATDPSGNTSRQSCAELRVR